MRKRDKIKGQSYWEFLEAKVWFQQNGEKVLNAIFRQIEKLKNAVASHDGYKNIIEGVKVKDKDINKQDDILTLLDYSKINI